jgi:hypothetical protein
MALHGGVIPYGGTFLIFSDYCRNAIRLSALQQIRVIYVLTHDSIGLGEDGPTHQPVEHVMSLRMIPNLHVFRPADVIETAECWNLALQSTETPSVLALTRQNLPQLRHANNPGGEMLSARGAYTLRQAQAERRLGADTAADSAELLARERFMEPELPTPELFGAERVIAEGVLALLQHPFGVILYISVVVTGSSGRRRLRIRALLRLIGNDARGRARQR